MIEKKTILIEQTNCCNLECIICPNHFHQRPQGYMNFTSFKNIIDQLLDHDKEIHLDRICLHGVGEPLLNPCFWKNLEYLDLKGFTNVDFSTNGTLLNNENINKLLQYKCLSWIKISLNSCKKEVMETMNTGAKFEIVVENIKNLLNIKPQFKVVIQHLITEDTKQETRQDYISLLGTDNFVFFEIDLYDFSGQLVRKLNKEKIVGCNMVFGGEMPSIQWDGDLVGCCNDDTKQQVYGNAIIDGIYSKKTQDRKKELSVLFEKRDFSKLPLCKRCFNN